ncbi:prephenate dehydrogenase [Blattabacterium cuenoti]|uniref:prephenate dehydrogenase n=1 Tax=Blattabacterium cuenoti TaxID=1653831 RepID=UPI00163C78E5|nr:prephenate dehydrogenase [Blattabacterium cuenoti]
MNIGIIGLGLIGGSIGLGLRHSNFGDRFIGTDTNDHNANYALRLGIVDEIIPLNDLVMQSSIIILSIPVDGIEKILPNILNNIKEDAVIFDTGSTKYDICHKVSSHPKRSRFVATHPIAGVEDSGPISARHDLFYRKNCIICDSGLSDPEAMSVVMKIYSMMEMHLIYITSKEHDFYISYISHLPHVISFSLSNTILKIFHNQKDVIHHIMGSGFKSTTRLSKSNPETWLPIFLSNKKNLIHAIDTNIYYLELFRNYLLNNQFHKIHQYLKKGNDIKNVYN